MSDEIWRRDEIASPCVNICVLHPDAKLCVGCFRTGNEIARWGTMTPEERDAIMAELPGREPKLRVRRGGRRARA